MKFKEQDIRLMTDGMGIVFYSPETNRDVPEGCNFFEEEYSKPEDVARHIKKGDVVGFCTGSGGNFMLKFREGYPKEDLLAEYPVVLRLGIDIQDEKLCVIDLFWLMEWSTKKPDSGIWGDEQTIFVYLNKLNSMPELTWPGVPQLLPQ